MIAFDKKTSLPTFIGDLSDEELSDARAVALMMRTKGWKVLAKYLEIGKQSIVDEIAKRSTEDNYKEKVPQWAAVLKGWEKCVHFPQAIVSRAEESLKEEVQDATDEN